MNTSDKFNKFKKDLRALCKKHKIKLKLIHKKMIPYEANNKITVSGYFDTGTDTLAVATDKDKKEWWEILIHESCHLDQFLENSPNWINQEIMAVDANALLDLWLYRHIEMTDKQIQKVIKKIIDCERDCDIRAIEKIKKYGLDDVIDLKIYTQKANAYHLSYYAVRKLRKWNKPLRGAYQVEEVRKMFGTTINHGYTLTKSQLLKMSQLCYPLTKSESRKVTKLCR